MGGYAIETGGDTTIIADLAVPAANSTNNAVVSDVAGNKQDASVTTVGTTKSLMAYLKGVLTCLGTPVEATMALDIADINSIANATYVRVGAPDGASLAADVAAIKSQTNGIAAIATATSSAESAGNISYVHAGGEQTVIALTAPGRIVLQGAWLDLVNITKAGTVRLYYKIDGTNYRLVEALAFDPAVDNVGFFINLNMGLVNDVKITYQEGSDEGSNRTIYYDLIYNKMT